MLEYSRLFLSNNYPIKVRRKLMVFCATRELVIRSLEHRDKSMMVKWLSDNKVLQYYGGRNNPYNESMVERKFYNGSNKTRCIIEYFQMPIGYIQFYPISKEDYEEYGLDNLEGIVYGADQFIGEIKYWGQGIGKLLIELMISYLVREKGVKKVVLDPQSWNERAIKCYEKCGFKKVKLLPKHELHEGEFKDCWVMVYDSLKSVRA
jgi:aminoglycoside 6'-N-acetyltransferase